ncbi:MAG: hypothetical protein Udaeo2_29100 [Candidatus Udaeobacter sp.]|nr:MAG: hypothetical protein Udaeo2_29100 [Candidatus Udaeobacter sp.]
MLLSRGGSADALGLFKNFVGRDPYVEPLLKRRGLDRVRAKWSKSAERMRDYSRRVR